MKYPGSKNKLAKDLHSIEPTYQNYVEPFGGTFAKFFVNPKPKGLVVYNDIDKRNANLFEQLILNPERIIVAAQFFINSRAIWAKFEKELKEKEEFWQEPLDLLDAIKWLYVNVNSFTGTGSSFKPTMNVEAPVLVSKLIAASRKLQGNVIVECLDFRELIKKYYERENTHFYLDPPYVVAEDQGLYRHNFTEQDHIDLRIWCDKITKADNTFLLSYDYDPEIVALYKDGGYEVDTMKFMYTMGGKNSQGDSSNKSERELIITNYNKHKQMNLFDQFEEGELKHA
jgi:DNA adenine methylase